MSIKRNIKITYKEEHGVPKCIYMHLKELPHCKNCLDLFACSKVTEHMANSLLYRAPADADFVPRKGKAGWVLEGPVRFEWGVPFTYKDWVWQSPQNGPIEFWYITPTDEAIALKQWAPGQPVYRIVDGSSYEKVKVAVPEGKWMHNNVQEWGAKVF